MDYMHLPILSGLSGRQARRHSSAALGQGSRLIPGSARTALLSALTPLLLGGAIAPAVVLPSQPAQAQSAQTLLIQRSLQEGDRGADVLELQKALVQRGLLNVSIPRSAREGYFGPATKAALQAFQRSERDLRADGVLGEATFRRLFAVGLTPTKAYSIALMQAQLSELGYYRSGLDGEFGPITERALRNLQDEAFVRLDPRPGGLENTFEVVSGYYEQQRQQQDLPHPDVLESRVERQLPQDKLFGFSSSFGGAVAIAPATAARSNLYQAIVPLGRGNDQSELAALRTFVGSVIVGENLNRGRYAQVGAYGDRQNAEEMVTYLRSRGFDARVIYD